MEQIDSAGKPNPPASPVRLVLLLCLAEILSMTGFATYPALLPVLRAEWGMSNSAAGLVSGSFFAGYMAAVPFLVGLTDRIDARRIYLLATALACVGSLAFAFFAQGLWTALLCQALVGAGLAGTYMPGLKVLTDNFHGPYQSRGVAFYTASFGFGTTASLLLAGLLEPVAGWHWVFAAAAIGPLDCRAVGLFQFLPSADKSARGPRHGSLRFSPGTAQPAGHGLYSWLCRPLLGVVRPAFLDASLLRLQPGAHRLFRKSPLRGGGPGRLDQSAGSLGQHHGQRGGGTAQPLSGGAVHPGDFGGAGLGGRFQRSAAHRHRLRADGRLFPGGHG
jgi:MFS family permease